MELRLYLESVTSLNFQLKDYLIFYYKTPMFAISRIPHSHQLNIVFKLKKILNNEE